MIPPPCVCLMENILPVIKTTYQEILKVKKLKMAKSDNF